MLIADDSREKKPNKRPPELQRTPLPSALTDSDVIPKSLQYHSRHPPNVIPDIPPMSFPTSPQCHSRRHPQCHSRHPPNVIPDVTPSVIPDVTPSVIPDVCNRESSQLKKRKHWIPANYRRE